MAGFGRSWFPNHAASHPGGAKVKSLGCCTIFTVLKVNIATSVGHCVSCQVKIVAVTVDSATFLLMTSLLCEAGV